MTHLEKLDEEGEPWSILAVFNQRLADTEQHVQMTHRHQATFPVICCLGWKGKRADDKRLALLFWFVWTGISSTGSGRLFCFNFYLQVLKQLSDGAE